MMSGWLVAHLREIPRWVARVRAPLSLKLQGAFLLILLGLVGTGWVSLAALGRFERQAAQLDRLNTLVTLAQAGLDQSIVAMQHFSSMFVMTGDEAYAAKLEAERQRFHQTLHDLQARGVTAVEVERIREAFRRYEGASGAVVATKRRDLHEYAQELHIQLEHLIAHEIEALTRALVASTSAYQQAGLVRALGEQRQAYWVVAGIFGAAILLALALGAVLARSIVEPVRQVDAALERIAAGDFVRVQAVVNRDELGSLVAHLNQTSGRLAELYAKEREVTRSLEERVESLARTQAQLIQAEKIRALGEMAGGVAHDFNNLLAVILGQVEILLRRLDRGEVSPDEVRRRAGVVREASLDGAGTVRRLLEFTRATPQAGPVEPIDPRQLFESVLAAAEPRWKDEFHARGRHVDVVTNLVPVPAIVGRPAELREVLLNLVFNALDAMSDGGRLELACWAEEGVVGLSVSDTGPGMSEEVAARVFEPFFTTKGPQSSGLGLSVSYGIVRRHQGDLRVDSVPGRGTRFTIRLPVRDVPSPAPGIAVESAAEVVAPLNVLVVDDEPAVRRVLHELLAGAGHRVWEATGGVEALAIMECRPVDLLCTDLGMPGMTGWQLADRVRATWPGVRIALVTGWGARITQEELTAHGADFLITKPFEAREVLRVVGSPCPRSGRRAEAAASPPTGEGASSRVVGDYAVTSSGPGR